MAITPGAQRGQTPYQVNGAEAVAPVRPGNSTTIVLATAVSGTATLPVDPQGNAYAAYRVTASASVWFGFGSGPAVPGTANQWIVSPGAIWDVVPPPGTTQASAIGADAITAASVSIVGLY
jgi:hypothetical protein